MLHHRYTTRLEILAASSSSAHSFEYLEDVAPAKIGTAEPETDYTLLSTKVGSLDSGRVFYSV